jgi:hypothetical protein
VRGLVEANLRGVMAAMYAPGVVAPAPAPPGGLVGTILDRFGPQLQGAFATVERVRARWPRALGGTR